jgi:hypothetical protein
MIRQEQACPTDVLPRSWIYSYAVRPQSPVGKTPVRTVPPAFLTFLTGFHVLTTREPAHEIPDGNAASFERRKAFDLFLVAVSLLTA